MINDTSYYSCEIIEHGLDAQIDSINLCCRVCKTNYWEKLVLINNFDGKHFDLENFFNIKKQLREQQKQGNTISQCKGCIYLKKKEWDNKDYISAININNWIKCNADCIYCDKKFYKNKKEYKIYPLIKNLMQNKQLRPEYDITIAGGEPTISKDFDNIMKLFLKHRVSPIRVLTNGIKYNKYIEKGLKNELINIVVSPDSGTRETYKRIKKVDKFNQVWKNLKKYVSMPKDKTLVKTKYIIIPSINDTQKEFYEFIMRNKEAGVSQTYCDAEINWFCRNMKNVGKLKQLLDLYNYAKSIGDCNNINVELLDRMKIVQNIIEKK